MLGKPIFFDPTGKRARLLQAFALVVGTLSAVVMVLFAAILVVVNRPEDKSFDDQLASHNSIRCAWAPTCSERTLSRRRRRPIQRCSSRQTSLPENCATKSGAFMAGNCKPK